MRINIVLDESLIAEGFKLSGVKTKKLIGSCSFHRRERYEEGLARRMSARAQQK
jgi:Arc/MetJ family transcription regulator